MEKNIEHEVGTEFIRRLVEMIVNSLALDFLHDRGRGYQVSAQREREIYIYIYIYICVYTYTHTLAYTGTWIQGIYRIGFRDYGLGVSSSVEGFRVQRLGFRRGMSLSTEHVEICRVYQRDSGVVGSRRA